MSRIHNGYGLYETAPEIYKTLSDNMKNKIKEVMKLSNEELINYFKNMERK